MDVDLKSLVLPVYSNTYNFLCETRINCVLSLDVTVGDLSLNTVHIEVCSMMFFTAFFSSNCLL